MMKKHQLKTWPEYYDAIQNGSKTFEVRLNDRDYKVGDTLVLLRFDPVGQVYTGKKMERVVTYIMHGDQFGLDDDYCVMALGPAA